MDKDIDEKFDKFQKRFQELSSSGLSSDEVGDQLASELLSEKDLKEYKKLRDLIERINQMDKTKKIMLLSAVLQDDDIGWKDIVDALRAKAMISDLVEDMFQNIGKEFDSDEQ